MTASTIDSTTERGSFATLLHGLRLAPEFRAGLGVTLLLKRFRPRLPAVLLALMIPAALVITSVTSLGSAALPVMFAFGILGRHLALTLSPSDTPHPARTKSHDATRFGRDELHTGR